MLFRTLLHPLRSRRYVRPWALSAPILILLISVPLLRPLRSPDVRLLSDDERSRLATIQGIVENKSLAIEGTDFRETKDRVVGIWDAGERFPTHYYSSQPPMLALLMSGPYWLLHHAGITLSRDSGLAIFWLTLLCVTLPVALSAGIVYRMGRIFELGRPKRALLALMVVIASGLISYSTVLNAHAPAAALLLLSTACLIHVISHNRRSRAAGWLALSGLCAALAATIDPPAIVFLVLLLLVIGAFRWPIALRVGGLCMYVVGAALPLAIHARFNRPITGDMRPGSFHPELAYRVDGDGDSGVVPRTHAKIARVLAVKPAVVAQDVNERLTSMGTVSVSAMPTASDDEDEPQGPWHQFLRGSSRVVSAFLGNHGVLSHFPVVILGIIGVTLIMHRHWPAATKMLAGITLGGGLVIILSYALNKPDSRDAMFATRWFVVFMPLTLFWAGAWLRKPHRQSSWILAAILLAFSVCASLIGATGPLPRNGFDHYSLAGAWQKLTQHASAPPTLSSPIADRGGQDELAE